MPFYRDYEDKKQREEAQHRLPGLENNIKYTSKLSKVGTIIPPEFSPTIAGLLSNQSQTSTSSSSQSMNHTPRSYTNYINSTRTSRNSLEQEAEATTESQPNYEHNIEETQAVKGAMINEGKEFQSPTDLTKPLSYPEKIHSATKEKEYDSSYSKSVSGNTTQSPKPPTQSPTSPQTDQKKKFSQLSYKQRLYYFLNQQSNTRDSQSTSKELYTGKSLASSNILAPTVNLDNSGSDTSKMDHQESTVTTEKDYDSSYSKSVSTSSPLVPGGSVLSAAISSGGSNFDTSNLNVDKSISNLIERLTFLSQKYKMLVGELKILAEHIKYAKLYSNNVHLKKLYEKYSLLKDELKVLADQIKKLESLIAREQEQNSRENAIGNLESSLATVGDDAQLANIDLQNQLQKQQQTLQTISNLSKMLHDTAMTVVRKIG